MSFAAERASIEGRMAANWATTPIAYDNVDFDPPNASAWVRLNILNGDTAYRALEGKKRYSGMIVVQCFAPKNSGTETLRGYADSIGTVFEDQIFDDVVCRAAILTTVRTDANWHQINVTIPYWRDQS